MIKEELRLEETHEIEKTKKKTLSAIFVSNQIISFDVFYSWDFFFSLPLFFCLFVCHWQWQFSKLILKVILLESYIFLLCSCSMFIFVRFIIISKLPLPPTLFLHQMRIISKQTNLCGWSFCTAKEIPLRWWMHATEHTHTHTRQHTHTLGRVIHFFVFGFHQIWMNEVVGWLAVGWRNFMGQKCSKLSCYTSNTDTLAHDDIFNSV